MELFRDQIVILNILVTSKNPVSGISLADYLNSSLKTIKKEIDELNVLCLKNGCEIVSKVGTGYEVEIYDNEKYQSFKDDIVNLCRNHFYYLNDQHERVHYIIRKFLVEKNLYINELVYECNVSESTIRRDMPLIKSILGDYKLYIANRTNKGMSLEGDEWHIRMACLNEEFLYAFQQKVYFKEPQVEFENMMLMKHEYLSVLRNRIQDVMMQYSYVVSYSSLIRFIKLLILTYNRQKEAGGMIIPNRAKDIDITLEKEVVKAILDGLMVFQGFELSETELFYLAAYLKSERMMKYSEFEKLEDKGYYIEIVNDFIEEFKKYMEVGDTDTSQLYMDLCVEICKLHYRTLIDSHVPKQHSHQYRRDGLTNLDACVFLYYFAKEKYGLEWNPYDVATLYHIFTRFTNIRDAQNAQKILVVSNMGYFVSSTIASRLNSQVLDRNVRYIPMEYMRLRNEDLSQYAGIISNINIIRDDFPQLPYRDLNYLRRSEEMQSVGDYFLMPLAEFQEFFTIDDLYEDVELKEEEEIYAYVKSILPGSKEKKDCFIELAKKKNANRFGLILVMNLILIHLDLDKIWK